MALEIQNKTIVGTVDNLQEKLNGELPINKLELLSLINSWGRDKEFSTNENIIFPKCEATQCYDLSKLDTSEITDMNYLFTYSRFNGDISNWDVSKVTDMSYMFEYAKDFNQALNSWDVSSVIDMSRMFAGANNFNQALNSWDVSNVTNMRAMFNWVKKFNQALNDWNISSVTNMRGMFYEVKEFNQSLDNWDVSNVINMSEMFGRAIAFEKRFNNEKPLPEDTNNLKVWFINNRDKMLAIETLNNTERTSLLSECNKQSIACKKACEKESTPEQKIAIIENKISNKTTLDELFKEKNINPNSKIGLELLKVYNDTHDKLKLELEDLKTQVVDIATNDFIEKK